MAIDPLLFSLQAGGLAVSLVLLYKGGESLVEGSSALAMLFGVAPLVVGLTVVAYGTSMPEMVVSVTASVQGNPGIAAGNALGSNLVNMLLILGIVALIAPIAVPRRLFRRDVPILIAATSLVCLLTIIAIARLGAGEPYSFDRVEGVILLACFAVYASFFTRMAIRQSREYAKRDRQGTEKQTLPSDEADDSPPSLTIKTKSRAVGLLLLGLVGVLAGGYLLVWSASGIARQSGISEEIIGLTIVAVGTSLPELVTSVIAARKNRPGIALGNIVGSNIFNGLLILGVAASIAPLDISPWLVLDAIVMLGVTLVLVAMLRSSWRLGKLKGAILFGGFVVYLASMFFR